MVSSSIVSRQINAVRSAAMPRVRPAAIEDAHRIAELLHQLGYGATAALIEKKVAALFASSMDLVLVAESKTEIIGVISLHVLELFHAEGRCGRITSLVADSAWRGTGIGTLLVQAADQYFIESGCVRAEVTSGDHRPEAHAFYQALGFAPDERRFVKRYKLIG